MPSSAGSEPASGVPASTGTIGPAVWLDRVAVALGGHTVLQDITLRVPAGAITAVVGRSGAGKTTLLRTLNGLVPPAEGEIGAAGIGPLGDAESWRRHRRRIATVFQNHALIDRLSALDNVLLGVADQRHPLSLLPWPRDLRRRAAEALDAVGMLGLANRPVSRLSGGERQRVGLARALVREPDLLLADEPFASVDPTLIAQLTRDFREAVHRRRLTVVIVLHQIETARALADRIVGLAEGRVVFEGTPAAFDQDGRGRIFHAVRPARAD
ncbi:Phosphonates import ATP-binding protein PhnC 2 [Rhodovastum atsumiense]|uniref:ATP-binding cassette domain-containing protein n=1 Tax=Rhodovastum atsumiense TaxID=504468 RepID=A0A5M6J1C3_9PROT|nr:ATP-binding cassette domain-containing protein [Rhodovastum atsumiense]KAA5613438.1 ATP-binding cassette domain-containing protein [Rhodovastum atsumiense]CAH2603170.1 Phosphonates import ATP-binding protein PhnC 2 [Rhodovastum atsumiense]